MLNEELVADLKRFIAVTVSQEIAGLLIEMKNDLMGEIGSVRSELKSVQRELKADIKALDHKVDTIQAAVADALTHSTEATDLRLDDHEHRLCRLEPSAA